MSEAFQYPISEHAEHMSVARSSSQQAETILLCKNSLISIGFKYLLDGTRFAITSTAADETSVFTGGQNVVPTLFIIDGSDLPGRIAEAAGNLKGRMPEARIVVIAESFDVSFIKLAREAGVDGFCQSSSSRDVLIKSLELVMLGEAVLPTSLMVQLLDAVPTTEPKDSRDEAGLEWSDPRLRKLSTRESQILHCLTDGAPNKVIARKLDVAEATVKVHVKAILRKIGAANRTQAAMWAATHLPTNVQSSLRA
jgi:two-component system, NarL family, nitrate/nitrite response regulator NarL